MQFGNGVNNWDIAVDVPSNQPFNNVTVNMFDGVAFPLTIASGKTMTVVGTFTHTNGAIDTGTISAQGHVTINAGADGGTGLLSFTGTANQTYTQSGDAMDGLVTVNKASGTVTLASAATWNAAGQNLTVTSGTLDLAGFALSTGTLTVAAAGTVVQGAGIITASNISNAGTFTGGSAAITVSGNVTLAGGTFTSTSGTLTVSGDWTHTAGGTFNHNSGTVVAAGNSLPWDVAGTETFNNFTVYKTFGDSLHIALGDTLIVGGTFTHTEGGIYTGTVQAQGAVVVGAAAGGGTATVQIMAPGAQTIEGNGGMLPHLQVSKPNGTLSLGTTAISVNNLTIDAGNTLSSTTGTLTVKGAWTNTAGGTFTHNSGTVVAAGNSLPWDVAGTETFNNFTVYKTFGDSLHIALGDTLIVGGTFTHTEGGIHTGTVQAQGAVMVGAAAGGGTATVQIMAPGAQTIEGNGGMLPHLQVSKPNGTLSLGTTAISVNNLTIDAGNTLSSTTGTLTVRGAWTNTAGGTFTHNSGTVVAAGNGLPWDVAGTETFNNFTVYKTLGDSLHIALGDTLIVGGTFTHTEGGIYTGTVQVQGAVMVGAAAGGGTALLTFTGTANQTYTQAGDVVNGLVTINKASGTVTLASAATWNSAGQNLTVTSGTLDAAGFALSTGTLTVAGGTYTAGSGTQTFNGGLTVSSGTFTGSTGTVDVNGNLTISGTGILVAPAAAGAFTVSGNFAHTAGTFTHNSGTVTLDGTNQTISGSTTFNHLSKTETTNDTTDSILTFAAGTTQTILGLMTLDGLDADDRINLVSSTPGTQWRIDPQGARTIDYLDVQDSFNINSSRIQAMGTNSVNSGNNSGWSFVVPPNFTWIGDGADTNWLTTGNWQGGVVPGGANTAIFDDNSSKNAAINTNANVAGLHIDAGYKGTVTQGAANTVTVGAFNYSQADGTFTGSSAAITTQRRIHLERRHLHQYERDADYRWELDGERRDLQSQ